MIFVEHVAEIILFANETINSMIIFQTKIFGEISRIAGENKMWEDAQWKG